MGMNGTDRDDHDDDSIALSFNSCNDSSLAGDKTEEQPLAKRESKAVWSVRLLVIVVLFGFMVAVAVLVYYLMTKSEKSQFENQFSEDADKVLASIGTSFDLTLGGVDALVVSLASYGTFYNCFLSHLNRLILHFSHSLFFYSTL
jgi:hypothetical protein